jgi:peptide deformylase
MILPIVAYGDPILRKMGKEITPDFEDLSGLIDNMFETMYKAHGVGLAAQQIGKALRLFVIDAAPFADDEELSEEEIEFLKSFKRSYINPVIMEESGEEWPFNEGCLSIPGVNEDVFRFETIKIQYQDLDFNTHEEILTGLAARIFQHEYDHIEGVLFTDHLSGLKKRLLKKKLENITKGIADAAYRMRFPKAKRK